MDSWQSGIVRSCLDRSRPLDAPKVAGTTADSIFLYVFEGTTAANTVFIAKVQRPFGLAGTYPSFGENV